MRKYHIYQIALLIFALALGCASCSDKNTVDDILPGGDDDNGGSIAPAKSEVCLDWTANQDYVMKQMQNDKLLGEDNGYLSYAQEDGAMTAYSFRDNRLVASVVMMPAATSKESDAMKMLGGYSYIGDIGLSRVYTRPSSNTMATFSTKEAGQKKYYVVGFAPVASDKYESIVAPKVTTGKAENITPNGAKLTARIDNASEQHDIGFQYSTDKSLADSKPMRTGVSNGSFTKTLTGLKMGTTYYYRAFAVVDDVYYYGETQTFTTEKVATYSVGDLYPNSTSPEGIVFYTSNEGQHGKIVCFDKGYGEWDTSGIFSSSRGCKNTADGSRNNISASQPFGKWVKSHGSEWYGPALGELRSLSNNIKTVNAKLKASGRDEIEGSFWASTEDGASKAYVVFVANVGYMGIANGRTVSHTKNEKNHFIAVKAF